MRTSGVHGIGKGWPTKFPGLGFSDCGGALVIICSMSGGGGWWVMFSMSGFMHGVLLGRSLVPGRGSMID